MRFNGGSVLQQERFMLPTHVIQGKKNDCCFQQLGRMLWPAQVWGTAGPCRRDLNKEWKGFRKQFPFSSGRLQRAPQAPANRQLGANLLL